MKRITYKQLKKLIAESNEEIENGFVYCVKIWPGSGYLCQRVLVKTDYEDAEEALEKAVAFLDKQQDKSLLLDPTEVEDEAVEDGIYDRETGEESPEFQETYTYVDATMDGASQPWYIYAENLGIMRLKQEQIDKLDEDYFEEFKKSGAAYLDDINFKENSFLRK